MKKLLKKDRLEPVMIRLNAKYKELLRALQNDLSFGRGIKVSKSETIREMIRRFPDLKNPVDLEKERWKLAAQQMRRENPGS